MDSLRSVVELFGTSAAVLSTIGGFLYWAARRSAGLATKSYVEQTVEDEIDPIDERVETALDHARANEDELEELQNLLEGGSNRFDQGMMDFLEENIERTNEIQDELNEVRDCISMLRCDNSDDFED
ncbi:hypothetical protein [Halorussus salinus]|uniref:hypothetical protein n=1 Tax=Halorussus salinus TaxID=1364935 RepID=UPI001093045F|nr:hypothetical protein [Halorussus salinus]